MDPLLERSCEPSKVLKCIHIGLLCVQEDAADRPTMPSVVLMLASDTLSLPRPTEPAFSVGRVSNKEDTPSNNPIHITINKVTVSEVEPR